jgi:hypothetical protein
MDVMRRREQTSLLIPLSDFDWDATMIATVMSSHVAP